MATPALLVNVNKFTQAATLRRVALAHRVLFRKSILSLEEYLTRGSGKGIAAAQGMEPAAIIETVLTSGFRGDINTRIVNVADRACCSLAVQQQMVLTSIRDNFGPELTIATKVSNPPGRREGHGSGPGRARAPAADGR